MAVNGAAPGPLLVLTSVELEILERAHLAELSGDLATPSAPTEGGAGRAEAAGGAARGEEAAGGAARAADGAAPAEGADDAARAGGAARAADGAARAQARDSLVGRGLLRPDGALASGSAPAELLRLVLDLRLCAQTVIVAERFLGGAEDRPDLRMLHLLTEGGVVEDLHPDGLHGLELCLDPQSLTRAVVDAVVPADARPGTGASRVVDLTAAALLPTRLDHPVVLAELTRVRDGAAAPESRLLAAGPSGCFVAARPGRDEDGRRLVFDPVEPDRVADLVGGWVEDVVRPAG